MMVVRKNDILNFPIFLILLVFNCGRLSTNNESTSLRVDDITRDSLVHGLEASDSSVHEPEFMINGIALSDEQSLIRKIDNPIFFQNDTDEYPKLTICNKSQQKLTLLSYPGDTKNSVSYFILEHYCVESDKRNTFYVSDSVFVTNFGLTLDISGDIVRKKYASYNIPLVEQSTNSTTILTYIENDYKRNNWLKKYNMPSYKVKYHLVDNIVTKLEFGFQYP